ncbi:Sodium:dicarboxylate symporter family protein [Colletotrichum nymphaeae SA-01]|uniref:Amino acid transporter n=1 Tax=Colletotrichum nymphaeae SA-01 TaxID=1460502 RepID=A0A135RW81_9PEZI|nr:Sodium:dicarboxylate symporter family protein [Colletotrichum nymphaeae SA-01]
MEKSEYGTADKAVRENSNSSMDQVQHQTSITSEVSVHEKKPWWHPVIEPGSAVQIIIAAAIAVGIGLGVKTAHPDIPAAATTILIIPGNLWLRSLKAVVLPLIVTAMVLAVQKLKEISHGGAKLAKWTIGYYVITTIVAIVHSIIMTSQVWARLMTVASAESIATDSMSAKDQESYEERKDQDIPATVTELFNSLIPANVVDALASDHLLAVLVSAVVIGYLIDNRDGQSSLIKAAREVETLIMIIITFLIKLAPIGVFFLILPNMFKLDINDIGVNLGILMGGAISSMFLHLFIILPLIFFAFTRQNPYTLWFKCSPAWLTAWGTASSAATLAVTMKCCRQTLKVPETVTKFAVPLGCLVNMDGTAIYFPIVVVFLAQTQGHVLNAADYIIILLLSTLASIGTTPIPSSSLVLTVMISSSVGIPPSGMYGVVVAIDWFIDRFRTATNVSGDLFAAVIVTKMTGITDPVDGSEVVEEEVRHNDERV